MPLGNWTKYTPGGAPTARKYAGLAYDANTSKLLLFGGHDGSTPYLGDTWLLATATDTWAVQSPAASPSARYGHGCCIGESGPVIFGGRDSGGLKQDLWEWTGSNWVVFVPTGGIPAAREFAAIANVNTSGEACLLWGGDTGGAFDPYVWMYYTGIDDWLATIPYTNPEPRMKHTLYYDSLKDRVIMFGGVSLIDGRPLNDIWEWIGNDWQQITTESEPIARAAWQGMDYDPTLKRAVLAPTGIVANGTITCVQGDWFNDAETFTLDDGVNTPVIFAFNTTKDPTDVTLNGWDPVTTLTFELTSLLGTADESGTSIDLVFRETGFTETVVSTFSGGLNLATSTAVLGQTATPAAPPSNQTADYKISITPNPAHGVIETGDNADITLMRDRIITAINAASPLNINAVIQDASTVALFNTVSDDNGNTTSADTVTNPAFIITDMTGATPDSWSYNRTGGLWFNHLGTGLAPILEGASLAYDVTADTLVLFGGAENGVLANAHYEWSWLPTGVSPLYSLPGGLQGRLQPRYSEPTDGLYVMVLGADQENFQDYMLLVGDEISITQQATLTGHKLIRFDWHMRYSKKQQPYETLLNAASVDFIDGSLLKAGDGLSGIRVGSAVFTADHQDQLVKISGAPTGANNNIFRISAVPANQGDDTYGVNDWNEIGGSRPYAAGQVAIVENASLAVETGPTVTLEMLGLRWVAEMYIDGGSGDVLCAQLKESEVQADPDGWVRANIAAHISKLSALSTLTFKLKLERYPY